MKSPEHQKPIEYHPGWQIIGCIGHNHNDDEREDQKDSKDTLQESHNKFLTTSTIKLLKYSTMILNRVNITLQSKSYYKILMIKQDPQ